MGGRSRPAKILPLPLREGVGGRGRCQSRTEVSRAAAPPPNPLPQGEGENTTLKRRLVPMRIGSTPATPPPNDPPAPARSAPDPRPARHHADRFRHDDGDPGRSGPNHARRSARHPRANRRAAPRHGSRPFPPGAIFLLRLARAARRFRPQLLPSPPGARRDRRSPARHHRTDTRRHDPCARHRHSARPARRRAARPPDRPCRQHLARWSAFPCRGSGSACC